ncbi:DUF2203 domain-containing protein [Rubripirellula amarantea]|uniref:DUF2203 domain-containing protein n=1 Tax=Rubripirellula amarantea TaxID=2527999 RepID=A0A5C5WKQ4_9BACT|nr:DUF2203 domain-containing protein [Rubripirellula amarantea]MDA8743329.1 DUF2203 domain-containing protein [Rubripirellula amarantea]TWT51376.1 hypothetical protein Pla22_41530 [Rubripirellula amarantea]
MVRAIDNDESGPVTSSHPIYTPSAATQTLPFVRSVVRDLLKLRETIDAQRKQLKVVDKLPETISQPEYEDELSDMRRSLRADEDRLNACLQELRSLGVETKDPFDGHVDFPAMLNRRPIRLCWEPEDETVSYWHEINENSDQRKKIDHAMLTALAT